MHGALGIFRRRKQGFCSRGSVAQGCSEAPRELSHRTQRSNSLPAGPLPSTRCSLGSTAPSDLSDLHSSGTRGPSGAWRNPNGALLLKEHRAEPPSSAAPPSLPDYSPHTELFMEVLLFFFSPFERPETEQKGKKAATAARARTQRLIFSAEEIICYISPQPDNPLLLKDEVSINVCLEQM